MNSGIGIEIKVTGGPSDIDTRKQLLRYGRTGAVSGILLITTVHSHLREDRSGYHVPVASLHIEARRNPAYEPRYRSFNHPGQ